MEKKEAVREYCLSKAIELYKAQLPLPIDEVIKTAKRFEKYILESAR